MSEVHDQAIHLLAMPQIGTFLTPEGREMVLRALDEVDALRRRAEKAEACLDVAFRRLEYFRELAQALLAHEDSPAAPKEDVVVPSATPLPTEPAGDVSSGNGDGSNAPPTQADAPAHGEQREHRLLKPEDGGVAPPAPASFGSGTGLGATSVSTPTQAREPGRVQDSVAPAVPETGQSQPAAKWGRADGTGAFHLWREGFSESECAEEVCDGEVLYSDPIPDNTCLSCAAIAGWDVPEQMSKPDKQPELPTIKRACAGFNKSADVPCGSPNVSVQRGGKWFCKRHDPERSKVCLVPGCDKPGRTAKGSPGIWCKEHGEKLSAEERTDIAERGKRLEAANG